MTFERVDLSEDVTLYRGDCLEVLPTLGRVDAVVTDPPYGMGYVIDKRFGNGGRSRLWNEKREWDIITPKLHDFVSSLCKYEKVIIWGGNYYAFPPTKCWLIWDKVQEFSGADAELAWTNLDKATKIFRMSRIDAYVNRADCPKEHPAEKPISLMMWCLSFLLESITVIDPFMGSGTTGVAAVKLGRRFIGIEIDAGYFEIAKRRISEALAQPPLFRLTPLQADAARPGEAEQLALDAAQLKHDG